MKATLVVALLLVCVAVPARTQGPTQAPIFTDGWSLCRGWNHMQLAEKLSYVMGYREGIAVATDTWVDHKITDDPEKRMSYISLLSPHKLNNGEVAGRIDTYCSTHEPDEVVVALEKIVAEVSTTP